MLDWDALVLAPLESVFGEPVVHTPRNGMPKTLSGVFDNAYQKDVMFEDGSVGVTEVHAVLGIRTSEAELAPSQNDQIFVPRTSATYIVRDVRSDGHGWVKLILSKASQW